MLALKSQAEVRAVALRTEFHGEDRVKAITVKLSFKSVPLETVMDAFVAQLSLFYGKDGDPQLPDLEPLSVSRYVGNVVATIGGVVLQPMEVDNVKLTLLPNRSIDVELKVKGPIQVGADALHDLLMDTVDVELVERAFEEVEQEQAAEAA